MTPAKIGYKIIFSRDGVTQPAIYAYFSDFANRSEIARVVWQHAEADLREAGNAPDSALLEAHFEERLNARGYKIVSYKTLRGD